jgi:prepilin-type N-terminal cleavage/methylation domain-containing protein
MRIKHFYSSDTRNDEVESGFTMVELLVTIFVGAIVVGTIVNLFSAIGTSQLNVWYMDVATRAARSAIENARTKGVNSLALGDIDITSTLPTTLPTDAKGTMNVGSVFAGQARFVTVTITWRGGLKKVILSGVVGRQGLIP